MVRSTSIVGAFCLALLLPALADAQGFRIPAAGAAEIGARLTARPIAAPAYAAIPTIPAPSSPPDSCRTETVTEPEPQDPRWHWRLSAFRHLDCVTSLVEHALAAAPRQEEAGQQEVRIAREDLEQIRRLAWWARDAAARIGQ